MVKLDLFDLGTDQNPLLSAFSNEPLSTADLQIIEEPQVRFWGLAFRPSSFLFIRSSKNAALSQTAL